MSQYIEWSALGQVVVAGLLVGAGLPAMFALGLKLLAPAVPAAEAATLSDATSAAEPVRLAGARIAGAVACFAVVGLALAFGIVKLVAGGH